MSTEAIDIKRAPHKFGEFDLLKAIAILGLPIVHTIPKLTFNYSFKALLPEKDSEVMDPYSALSTVLSWQCLPRTRQQKL